MEVIVKGFVPPNMDKNTRWSKKCFMEWVYEINKRPDCSEKCPEDILERQSPEELNQWISKFIAEARRTDGQKYTPRLIHPILSGLLRYMCSLSDNSPNVLNKNDTRFKNIQRSCEAVFRSLRKEGIGAQVKHAPTISTEEEKRLWDTKVLDVNTPKGLSNAVFFYAGKVCCLRGGEEQRNLKPSQFVRSTSGPNMYEYIENGSKNRSGGLAQLKVENKIVKIHTVQENEPRCLVFLLHRYFAKLPKYAFDADVFYLHPKVKNP